MRALWGEKSFFHRYSPLILHYFLSKPRPGWGSTQPPPPSPKVIPRYHVEYLEVNGGGGVRSRIDSNQAIL